MPLGGLAEPAEVPVKKTPAKAEEKTPAKAPAAKVPPSSAKAAEDNKKQQT